MFKQLSVNLLPNQPQKAPVQDESLAMFLDGIPGSSDIKSDPVVVKAIQQGISGMELSMLRRMRHGLTLEERRGLIISLLLDSFGCSDSTIRLLVVVGSQNTGAN